MKKKPTPPNKKAAKKKQWTIETAEAAINKLGEVRDGKIILPDDITDHKGTKEYEDFWDANTYLRTQHDYDSSSDDVLIWF